MTARKSDKTNKVVEEAAEIEANAGPIIDLEADDITEQAQSDEQEPAQAGDDKGEQEGEAEAESESEADTNEVEASEEQDASETDSPDLSDEMAEASDADQDPVQDAAQDKEEESAETSAAASSANEPSSQKNGGSLGGGLIGGLLGGVVALGLGYGGLQQGLISLPQSPADKGAQSQQAQDLSAVKQTIAGLESKIAALPEAGAPVDLSGLESRIADAEAQLASLQDAVKAATGSAGAGAIAAPSGEASADASSDGSAPASAAPAPIMPDLGPIEEQLSVLATDLAGVKEQLGGFDGLSQQLKAAEDKLAGLESQASEQADKVAARFEETQASILASADRRIDNLVTDFSNMSSTINEEAKALQARLSSLEDNNLSEKMQSSARTIALAGLENAVAAGRGFTAALDTFAQVAADNEAVQALKAYAEKGAPDQQVLADEFRSLSGKLLKAAEAAGATSLVDKIMLNAQNLVRVRPVGEQEGESLSAKLARIEVRVKEGRLGEVAPEWESLPDAAKEAGKGWYESLKARLAVDAAMQSIRAEFGKEATAQ
ncbi:MAG: hypothetical protein N4A65_07605 [Cohaesibacter sp.]|jgi:hypothetical protein|nr:hypothetical protein [Cohaesibacter sp.]